MARSYFYYHILGFKSFIRRKKYKSYKGEQGKITRNEYQIKEKAMSRKGNCLDNAIIENFFGILKSE